MLVRVEIVTPRSSQSFLDRIEDKDPKIDHLCLELVHWGFNEAMAWIYKVHAICREVSRAVAPGISVHGGFEKNEITPEQQSAIVQSGALWMPRNEDKNLGKDCATIIHEMFSCRSVPVKKEKKILSYPDDFYSDSDLETYRDLGMSTMIGAKYDLPNFTVGRPIARPSDIVQDLDLLFDAEMVRDLPNEEFAELLRNMMREIE